MNIAINTGNTMLIFFAVIFAVIVLIMLLKKGRLKQKMISLIIIIVAFAAVFFFFGRGGEVSVTDEGVNSGTYGRINFGWSEVTEARIIDDYEDTGWKPVIKINGTAFPGFRAGRFRLENGDNAKIITQKSKQAVVFRTDDGVYLFALDEHEKFSDSVSLYIDLK